MEGSKVRVYKIEFKEDGTAELHLSHAHKAFILYLAQNGGEVVMDWEAAENRRKLEPEKRIETVKEHMSHLITVGVMTELPLLFGGRVSLRLTDIGRNVVDAIKGKR